MAKALHYTRSWIMKWEPKSWMSTKLLSNLPRWQAGSKCSCCGSDRIPQTDAVPNLVAAILRRQESHAGSSKRNMGHIGHWELSPSERLSCIINRLRFVMLKICSWMLSSCWLDCHSLRCASVQWNLSHLLQRNAPCFWGRYGEK